MRLFLVALLTVLLTGCAQVGFLTGGDRDEYAPVPKINPENGQTQFNENAVQFTFNEYVTLNNPKENIFMMPQVNGLQVELKKKTLTVKWTEALLPNTTYVLYLNNAVKDLHEGNDSLMTYVFSTGSVIDSLNYNVSVSDAWTNEALKNVFVGLYADTNTVLPLYFSRSNGQGKASFSNLKTGSYVVRAFPDEDKDRKQNRIEMRGFRESLLVLDSSQIDTLPIRLSKPVGRSIRGGSFIGPGLIGIGAPFDLTNATFRMQGQTLEKSFATQTDSVLLAFCPDTLVRGELEVLHQFGTDTIRISLSKRDKEKVLNWRTDSFKKGLGPHQRMELELADMIDTYDISKMRLTDPGDSSEVEITSVNTEFNKLILEFKRNGRKTVDLKLEPGAAIGACGKASEKLQQNIVLKNEKDFGSLSVSFTGGTYPLIIELLAGMTVVERRTSSSLDIVRFDHLEPVEYNFRIVIDDNENGRWDVGDESINKQPENVLYFSTSTKVRGNWESEVELDLQK